MLDTHLLLLLLLFSIDPLFMLATPWQCEILPPPIWKKVQACLAAWFNVQKKVVQSIVKLDQPITQHGRVYHLDGGDHMVGHHFVKETEDSWDSSFVQVESRSPLSSFHIYYLWAISSPVYSVCRLTCLAHEKNTGLWGAKFPWPTRPYSPSRVTISPKITLSWANNTVTTVIIAVIQEVKANLKDGIYSEFYY